MRVSHDAKKAPGHKHKHGNRLILVVHDNTAGYLHYIYIYIYILYIWFGRISDIRNL